MSELDNILDVASDNADATFRLTATSQAVCLFALELLKNTAVWRDFPDEDISAQLEQIEDITDQAINDCLREVQQMAFYAGMMMPYAGGYPIPDALSEQGWLPCYGGSYAVDDYPDLFEAIGNAYNIGDEAPGVFRVPDLTDRSMLGAGGMIAPGQRIGEAFHQLTILEMPIHNHSVTDPGHNHAVARASSGAGISAQVAPGVVVNAFNTANNTTGITIGNAGAGNAHNNIHPVLGTNFLIMSVNPT